MTLAIKYPHTTRPTMIYNVSNLCIGQDGQLVIYTFDGLVLIYPTPRSIVRL